MIRVLVVDVHDDERARTCRALAGVGELQLVAALAGADAAMRVMHTGAADALVLDVDTGDLRGLRFLRAVTRARLLPVVVLARRHVADVDVERAAALLGAASFVEKRSQDEDALAHALVDALRAATRSTGPAATTAAGPSEASAAERTATSLELLAIGASTGGTEALARVFAALGPGLPPIVVTQHMPPGFTRRFAERLHRDTRLTVCEAEDGQPLEHGHAYVAPGQRHLVVTRVGSSLRAGLEDTGLVNRHRPSVDVLFASVAASVGRRAAAVLLTGMGDDGARGLHQLRLTGAWVGVQDEASSVVWGMPGAALRLGPVDAVLPLDAVPRFLERVVQEGARPRPRRASRARPSAR